jgi:hypothetical protein
MRQDDPGRRDAVTYSPINGRGRPAQYAGTGASRMSNLQRVCLFNRTNLSSKTSLLILSHGEAASVSGQILTEGLVSRRVGEI